MSSLKVGIVGLPNVGKSTLFNALLKKRVALSANYPFATVEPNVGVVAVPDSRLEKLADLVKDEEKMENLPPLVPAVVEFVDIAGLVKGASTGEGLGNLFLSHIREVDCLIHVLRDFKDENIIRSGSVSPDEDKLTIETELSLSDLQVIEKLVLAQEKSVRGNSDPIETKKLDILKKLKEDLERGLILGELKLGDEAIDKWFKNLPLLTTKPTLSVYNVDESEVFKVVEDENSLVICAKLEEELADLSDEDRAMYLQETGLSQTGLEKLITKAYYKLDLVSFLTAGKKEVRAWTTQRGTKAPQAAGIIHSDFEKGFIRAQVVEFEKLIEAGSYGRAKQLGLIKTEGKDYIIKDGDVVEFLVNS